MDGRDVTVAAAEGNATGSLFWPVTGVLLVGGLVLPGTIYMLGAMALSLF